MIDNWNASLAKVLESEGGFVNHPRDPAGATNLGITKATYENWVGRHVAIDEMRQLTVTHAAPIYKQEYWDRVRADELPDGVDLMLFDFAVNAGVSRAVRTAQRVVGVVVDGKLGPKTLAAIRDTDPLNFIKEYTNRKLAFYRRLKTYDVFGRGWEARSQKTQIAALNLLRD